MRKEQAFFKVFYKDMRESREKEQFTGLLLEFMQGSLCFQFHRVENVTKKKKKNPGRIKSRCPQKSHIE